ncbi:MAG: fimbria/pilus outer membrane usher protein [Byssovorax sp.]
MKSISPLLSRSTLPLLLFTLLLLGPRLARGAADQRAILNLVLNHLDKGEISVVLRDGDVLAARDDLARAGLLGVEGRTEQVLGKKAVSFRSLAPALSYAVDEDALALRVEVPVRMLKTTVIDASRTLAEGIEQRRDPSAFLNYAVHLGTPLELDGFLEMGISLDGNLIQSSLTATSEGKVVRGLSSFTIDDRSTLRRWVVGEALVSSGALGSSVVAAGVTVSKSFALDPYLISAPTLGYTGSTATPAVVDVYVNGMLVKSQILPPGPFQVQNLQTPTGNGEVRYVLRDVFGRQQTTASPYYLAARSLAKGLSEYTTSLGARRLDLGAQSFSYGQLGLLAYQRRGLTDRLTAGARVEAAAGLVSGGASATVTLPVGQIDLELAASAARDGSGAAALAAYTFVSRRFSGGVAIRSVSDSYSTLSLTPRDDRQRAQASAFTGVAAGRHLTLATQYALAIDRDAGASFRVGLSSSAQISRRLSLSAGLGRAFTAHHGASFDAFLGLSLSLDNGVTASVSARQDADGSREAYAEISKSLTAENGVGGRVAVAAGKDWSALAIGQFQGPYGRYQATLQTGSSGPSASLDATGALVLVHGAGLLATRPVQEGFAVIQVPGVPGVRGYLDNHEIGRTDRSGNLVVPGLLPYYGNRIMIADTDLPLDRAVGAIEQTIAPSYRGGALVRFDVKVAHFFRGHVVVERAGKTITPAYGEISVHLAVGEVTSPLGKNGEFELSEIPPGKHEARVEHTAGVCTLEIVVPTTELVITDLGALRCVQ